MRQVIQNLLNNAIKFAQKENMRICISLFKIPSWKIHLQIEDNGEWFQEGKGNALFEKYTTGKGESIGLGLWLYLCKKIVELHEGKIYASNGTHLCGACFTITF